jgi:mRNA (guanine-N7-)-methyltransferase
LTLDYEHEIGERRLRNGKLYRDIGQEGEGLRVLEIGCGKGGDLHKWQKARQKVDVFVGLDPVGVLIQQARERWARYQEAAKHGEGLFQADFYTQYCFGESIESVPMVQEVGFDREKGGGFDVVSMMFCMHYAFEKEENVRMMWRIFRGH